MPNFDAEKSGTNEKSRIDQRFPRTFSQIRMPRFQSLSIRTMLGLLALACTLPIALVAGYVISHDYQRERDQLILNTVTSSRALANQLDQVFAGVETSLSVLETSPTVDDPDRSKFYRQAKAILGKQLGRNILLSHPDGQQLVNTLSAFGAPLPNRPNLAQVAKLRITHAPVVSDLFNGATDGQPIVSVAIPVMRNGEHRYNISSGLVPSLFSNLIAQRSLPTEWVAAIVDSSGTIVARTRDNDKFVGKKVSPDLLSALTSKSEGFFNGSTLDGIGVVAGYSQSQITGWTTVIAIPNNVLTVDLHKQLISLAFGTGLILLLGLSLAMLISGRVIRANRGLIEPALALGEGKSINVPTFGVREADEVGEALKKASEKLLATQHKANHDNLTSLPNRGLFYDVVLTHLHTCARYKTTLAVLFIDLDGFKKINDSLGHAAGDEILREVANRLRQNLRASDISSRLGGDEFAVALPGSDESHAEVVAQKLLGALSMPYAFNSSSVHISASIGIAVSDWNDTSVEALVRGADNAMYEAKTNGKGRVSIGARV